MTGMRAIEAIPLADITPRPIAEIGDMPRLVLVRPTTLYIEESYQRDLGRRSVALIRRIVAGWDWSRFKPPACSELEDGRLVVIDGQHTAIAAACHPDIAQIPVLVSRTGSIADRANAFVGHNREHVAITALQIHRAAVAANDDVAVAVEEACRLAGVSLLATNRPRGEWRPGESVAISSITRIVRERGRAGGQRVLRILVRARAMPVSSLLIEAVYQLLYLPQWAIKDDAGLADVISGKTTEQWQAWVRDNRKGDPAPHTLAVELFRRLGSGRG